MAMLARTSSSFGGPPNRPGPRCPSPRTSLRWARSTFIACSTVILGIGRSASKSSPSTLSFAAASKAISSRA
jgi:hypothetical protein